MALWCHEQSSVDMKGFLMLKLLPAKSLTCEPLS